MACSNNSKEKRNESVADAARFGLVSESFAVQQIGLPKRSIAEPNGRNEHWHEGLEQWNKDTARARLNQYDTVMLNQKEFRRNKDIKKMLAAEQAKTGANEASRAAGKMGSLLEVLKR